MLAPLALFLAGYYIPTQATDSSICPHYVRRATPLEISVVYVGDCYWQGPYTYSCFGSVCLSPDNQVSFTWSSENAYRWENHAYSGYQADFEWKSPKPPESLTNP